MNLLIIGLVACLVIVLVIVANSTPKAKEEEVPEPLVNPSFSIEVEKVVVTKKLEKPVAAKKVSKPAAKPVAKTAAKKTDIKKYK